MSSAVSFDEIKTKQQKVWSSGDYGKIAWITVPLAETLVEAADLHAGARVLDVATGTGHVAIAAARRFCHVTGIDYVPALVESAQRRAAAEALAVDFQVADAENLPFEDDTFDYVFSAIGVMFTADHQRAADELVRVCRPGGRIAIASWTPAGFIGQLLKTVAGHAPPPAGSLPPTRWGDADTVRELLGRKAVSLGTTTVTQRFPSAEYFADFFLTHYGPTHAAAGRLDDAGRRAFRDDMIALATTSNRSADDTMVSDWEYLVAVADKS
ncbi:MAG: class I SAM-dependent methyltransferase [Actinophytocola sp.]|uniref:class I SAM-dependent methyltransferase n=1 Tax=Actinophytocola sp. TaxID=1872138 RepID=UPI003D6C5B9C